MLKIFGFITICFVYRGFAGKNNDDLKINIYTKIFEIESVTSYYECEGISVFYNAAQKLKLPVPGIPLRPITEHNVSFVIYSRQHAQPLVVNTYDSARSVSSLPKSFNIEKPTVVYVHGIHDTYEPYVPIFKNGLFPKEDINLIFMDWDSYADYNSMYSRNNTVPRLGNILGKFLRQYIKAGANPKDIYLIGISSGAQSFGIAGKQITNPKIGRILGIDPVGTCYNFGHDSLRLSRGDADFVQIVHCSVGEFGELSKFQGDATFYLNGGKLQPQCVDEKSLTDVNKCSHDSCGTYVYKTLYDFNKYIGVKCDSYEKYLSKDCDCSDKAVMGYNTSTKTKGTYYVDTASNSRPVCQS
ncbi:lipase member H-like [Planococcus citri]|uniref:lipase member H-like n=1 Tax=Planococcus citri TaxID=170843 RepID=UPI0031F95904